MVHAVKRKLGEDFSGWRFVARHSTLTCMVGRREGASPVQCVFEGLVRFKRVGDIFCVNLACANKLGSHKNTDLSGKGFLMSSTCEMML